MFNRPRRRDWVVPLSTQQIRLRNLIKITGQNVQSDYNSNNSTQTTNYDENIEYYYTLHLNKNSEAFYKSEKLKLHGINSQLNWNEINCNEILKSNSKFVCIKVWQHFTENNKKTIKSEMQLKMPLKINDKYELLTNQLEKSKTDNKIDKLLFIWGVYFSGLILLNIKNSNNTEVKYTKNSLSFEMHCGVFVSPNNLLFETQNEQLKLNYELELKEYRNNLSSKNYSDQKFEINSPRTSRSCSPERKIFNYSNEILPIRTKQLKNNSSDELGKNTELAKVTFGSRISAASTQNVKNSESLGSSPKISSTLENKNIKDKNEGNELFSSCQNSNLDEKSSNLNSCKIQSHEAILEMLKCRYLSKQFYKKDTRSSYAVEKLLLLQKQQRSCKTCIEDSKKLIEEISMKSPACMNPDLITSGKLYYNRPTVKQPSMGKTLNRLLFQEKQIKPEELLLSQDIKRKIEVARFRTRLLQDEVNKLNENIFLLNKQYNEIQDNNIEVQSWFMSRYRYLSRKKELLVSEKDLLVERREEMQKYQIALRQRKAQLCSHLKEIYPIEKYSGDKYTINNLFLPNTDDIILQKYENVSPLQLSAALGYVAHLVQMSSVLLNLPLRNPIKHEGSRSRILDVVKNISNSSREFPLYSRSNPPQNQVIYAIYLLNQNIAQLNFQANGIFKCDLKTTLFNLLQLITGPSTMGQFLLQLPEEYYQNASETSGSSIDLNVVPCTGILLGSKPIDVIGSNLIGNSGQERISRSVGSYSDELSETDAEKGFYNSAPILTQNPVTVNFEDDGNI